MDKSPENCPGGRKKIRQDRLITKKPVKKPEFVRDLRKYAKQTTGHLVMGALLLVFILGEVLIYLFYGVSAAITGLLCLAGAMVPILLIFGILWIIDRFTKRDEA